METEFEVKILDVDVEQIKKKLAELGAEKLAEKNMRRYVYDIKPEWTSTWIRLRDTGEKSTLTIKEIQKHEIDGTKEIEVVVNDFEKTNELLNKLGFVHKAYQENNRISYKLSDVKIEIDFWPMIPPYIEVEGKNKEDVEKVVKLLGFTMEQTTGLGVGKVFKHYGIEIHDFKELKFN